MANPTPGEWQAHAPNSPTGGWTICAHPSNRVFAAVIHERNMEPGEAEANARLMALAKELRAGLEDSLECWPPNLQGTFPRVWQELRNLLARTDGSPT